MRGQGLCSLTSFVMLTPANVNVPVRSQYRLAMQDNFTNTDEITFTNRDDNLSFAGVSSIKINQNIKRIGDGSMLCYSPLALPNWPLFLRQTCGFVESKFAVYALFINENDFIVCNKNIKNVSHCLFYRDTMCLLEVLLCRISMNCYVKKIDCARDFV